MRAPNHTDLVHVHVTFSVFDCVCVCVCQGAVPPIPHLPEALTTRPPQVVLLGCDEQETYDLRRRFEVSTHTHTVTDMFLCVLS